MTRNGVKGQRVSGVLKQKKLPAAEVVVRSAVLRRMKGLRVGDLCAPSIDEKKKHLIDLALMRGYEKL